MLVAATSVINPASEKQLRETLARVVEIDRAGTKYPMLALLRADSSSFLLVKMLAAKVSHNAQLDMQFLKSITDAEVVALARFLTLVDGARHGIVFGSASAVPTLVSELRHRNYDQYDVVVDWIFRNRSSPFVPFGVQFGREASSLPEYRLLEEEQRIRLERRSLDIQQEKVERRRSGCSKATHDLQNAIRRKDCKAFPRLVDRGANIFFTDCDGKTLIDKMDEVVRSSPLQAFGCQYGLEFAALPEYRLIEEEQRIRLERHSLKVEQAKVDNEKGIF